MYAAQAKKSSGLQSCSVGLPPSCSSFFTLVNPVGKKLDFRWALVMPTFNVSTREIMQLYHCELEASLDYIVFHKSIQV